MPFHATKNKCLTICQYDLIYWVLFYYILVLHLEGEKTWTVCNDVHSVDMHQRKLNGGKGIFKMGDDFGECTKIIFKPGDVLYAPMGTIHYAEAVNSQQRNFPQEYSLHLTISLDRQNFSWGK